MNAQQNQRVNFETSITKLNEIVKDMEKGDKFPPVQIHQNKKTGRFIVQNGAHGTMAARLIGKKLFIRIKEK